MSIAFFELMFDTNGTITSNSNWIVSMQLDVKPAITIEYGLTAEALHVCIRQVAKAVKIAMVQNGIPEII